MNEIELRGLMLEKYYQRRRERLIGLVPSDFGGRLSEHDILRIAGQLADHGLIHWRPGHGQGGGAGGMGTITAAGIDAVEGKTPAPLEIRFSQPGYRPAAAAGRESVAGALERLARAINDSAASAADKRSASALLCAFRQHPLLRIMAQEDGAPAGDPAPGLDPAADDQSSGHG
jgi:hypothetical protein